MVRSKERLLLSSLVLLALTDVAVGVVGPLRKAQPGRRLRKHKNQVFQAPKKGERRKGSHKSDYKHNDDKYPPYLAGFYGNDDHAVTEYSEGTEVPSHFDTDNFEGQDHMHSGTYHPTYFPTSSPTFFPTWSGEVVYKYSGTKTKAAKSTKSAKFGKSKGANEKGGKTKYQMKTKGLNHGSVYEVIYEDGYEETLMPGHPYHEPYDSNDPLYHYHYDDLESDVPDQKPDYGHTHAYGDLEHTHPDPPENTEEPTYEPTYFHDLQTTPPYEYLCKDSKSKSKSGGKGGKIKQGALNRYREPVEVMEAEYYYYDCGASKSKGYKNSKAKSKSRGSSALKSRRK
jgi:hypothetical protein